MPVAVFQRVDQAGYRLPIDERILSDTDTLMVFGLDHLAAPGAGLRGGNRRPARLAEREGNCLLLAPHHDVGFTDDLQQRQVEYLHHGDPLVPRQQRFSGYVRSLMKALEVPVHNSYGLRPGAGQGNQGCRAADQLFGTWTSWACSRMSPRSISTRICRIMQ